MKTTLLTGLWLISLQCLSQNKFKVQSAYDQLSRSKIESQYRSISLSNLIIFNKRSSHDTMQVSSKSVLPGGAKYTGNLKGLSCITTLINLSDEQYTLSVESVDQHITYIIKKQNK